MNLKASISTAESSGCHIRNINTYLVRSDNLLQEVWSTNHALLSFSVEIDPRAVETSADASHHLGSKALQRILDQASENSTTCICANRNTHSAIRQTSF
eukprot:gene1543-1681_t